MRKKPSSETDVPGAREKCRRFLERRVMVKKSGIPVPTMRAGTFLSLELWSMVSVWNSMIP